jgi:hypothetical protein
VIETTKDAPPVVLGVATTLKRAAANPKLARRLGKMNGVLALKSSVDTLSATIRFERGTVRLSPGVAPDAGVVITLDFNNMAAKPKVKGAGRHPLLALGAAKVLEPPTGTWQEEAEAFWVFARDTPRMPSSLLVVCTDDGSELRLGETGEPAYEIHGTADALRSVFSGGSNFGEDTLLGKLRVVGTTEHVSVLTGRSIAWMMGEGR